MSARFNSTSTGASAAPQSAGPNTPDPTPGSGLAESSDLSNVDVTTIPEGIGYLKSLGLEYGWGPTSMMQYIIEHIHVWTGLPWWASIIGAGLLLRLALLKPMIGAADNSAKMRNVNHLLAPLNAKATDRSLDEVERAKAVSELRLMFQKHGIKMYKTGLPFLQLPFGFGAFRAVRNMAALPVPGLANETVGWLTDLTARDPYFIVPAAGAALVHLSLKVYILSPTHCPNANLLSRHVERWRRFYDADANHAYLQVVYHLFAVRIIHRHANAPQRPSTLFHGHWRVRCMSSLFV